MKRKTMERAMKSSREDVENVKNTLNEDGKKKKTP